MKRLAARRILLAVMLAFLAAAGIATTAPWAEATGASSAEQGPPAPLTNVGGAIVSDTSWTLAGSPYVVTSSVSVSGGVTLTIEPGVEVRFNTGASMSVAGALVARGTGSSPITFTVNGMCDWENVRWHGLSFGSGSANAVFDTDGSYIAGSILDNVRIYCVAGPGATLRTNVAISIDSAAPLISSTVISNSGPIYAQNAENLRIINTTVSNGRVDNKLAGGMAFYSGTVRVENSTIDHCWSQGTGGWHGGVYAENVLLDIVSSTIADNGHEFAGAGGVRINGGVVTITGSVIRGNYAASVGGLRSVSATLTISDSDIIGNSGHYMTHAATGGLAVDRATVVGSRIVGNYGGTVGGASASVLTLSDSVVADNQVGDPGNVGGLHITQRLTMNHSTVARNRSNCYSGGACSSGILADGPIDVVSSTIVQNMRGIYGSGPGNGVTITGGLLNHSNIFLNDGFAVRHRSAAMVDATNNWWGATGPSIYDWYHDPALGIVIYTPFLTEPDTTAPPSPPTGLAATPGGDSIALSWQANPEGDIAGYRVYYDTGSGHPYANVITIGNTTAHTLTNLTGGYTYYLAITAYDADGDESWYSEEASALLPAIGGAVIGAVNLQGRINDSGATIAVGAYTATTAASGAFTVGNVAAGTYTATASMAGYLYAQRVGVVVSDGVTTTLPTVTLLGGDAVRDNAIDIYDLTVLGIVFGSPGAAADITGDGAVNVFDLTLVGANFGRSAPLAW